MANTDIYQITPPGMSALDLRDSRADGLGTAAYKDVTDTYSGTGTDPVTGKAVKQAIDSLPAPMIIKGTLGTGGTITSLPTASASNEGYLYKVITAGTYAGQEAKVGDFFVSCKPEGASAYTWIWFPAGDEVDTWRAIKVNGTEQFDNGISSGSVDFVNGTNTTVEYVANGKKIKINATDTNNRKAFYGTCSDAADTAAKTVTLSDTTGWELKAGTIVGIKFSNSNSASNVTLDINGTGAKSIWYSNAVYTGSSTIVSGYANRTLYYMYDGTYWVWLSPGVNDNTYDRVLYAKNVTSAAAITKNTVIVANANGEYRMLKDGSPFDISYPILYATSARSTAGSVGTDNYLIIPAAITSIQSMTLTPYKAIYIKGTLSGTTFTPESATPLTQTVPIAVNNYYYMYLGMAYSDSAFYLVSEHPIYRFPDASNGFIQVTNAGGTVVQKSSSVSNWRKVLLGNYEGAEDATASPDLISARTLYTNSVQVQPSTGTLKATNLKATNLNGVAIGNNPEFTDTKNTAGSTDTSSKIFLIGATSQAANPQTYSDDEVYTTNGVLTTKSVQVGGNSGPKFEYDSTNECVNLVFA